jgi:hypothetical protein
LGSLQVISAKFLRSGVVVTKSQTRRVTTIRSAGLGRNRSTAALQPIASNVVDAERHLWELFTLTLKFAFSGKKGSRKVLDGLDGVMRAEGGTIDLQSLVRSVAVEGIVRSGLPKERANKAAAAAKELQQLAKHGAIDGALIRPWKRMRDAVAHGAKLNDGNFAQHLRDLDAVTTLLYQLIFSAVGYRGPYLDHSSRPPRQRDYPIQPESAPGER